ncbi:MAG TPA: Zn-ribbon domain-containing OB-fold protein [Thermoplasmata archaeon]|nr:Zn-ribbon domain-containing OB-fold protein [Thermoplasmata archaeon]
MAHVSVPMYWRTIPQRYRLVGHKCRKCGNVNFPPKGVCKYCSASSDFEEVQLSGRGKVHTFTLIGAGGAPPEFAEQEKAGGSYPVTIVELEEGPKVIGQMADVNPKDVRIGMPVRAEMRRIYSEEGVIRYGFKFVPATEGA